MDIVGVLFGISAILFFGFLAEFLFKKFYIPDVMFLIILGIIIGPHFLNLVYLPDLELAVPIFTTFTLLFLLFDGAFNIDLSSFMRELTRSISIALLNFFLSAILILIIMLVSGFPFLVSLLTGFILGGVSSAFVIPLLKQLKIKSESHSVLTLESALTDVFCIVFSLTVIQILVLNTFSFKTVFTQLASLFAVAGLVGIAMGILWIVLVEKIFKEHKSYMITLAYLLLVYAATEWLNGNGAIAALFFGIVLRNSKQLTSIFKGITSHKPEEKKEALEGELGVSVTTPSERFFYDQISFFLKTFFFVYIGVLLNFSDWFILVIGIAISVGVLVLRNISSLATKKLGEFDRILINSIFARGLAAAAIAQIAIQLNLPYAEPMLEVIYIVITGTIILSSVKIFMLRKSLPAVTSNSK